MHVAMAESRKRPGQRTLLSLWVKKPRFDNKDEGRDEYESVSGDSQLVNQCGWHNLVADSDEYEPEHESDGLSVCGTSSSNYPLSISNSLPGAISNTSMSEGQEMTLSHSHPTCCSLAQFKRWQDTRPWLMCEKNLAVCVTCRKVKRLPSYSGLGTSRIDLAFVDGITHTSSKNLLKKIDKHRKCNSHKHATEIVKRAEKQNLERAVEHQRKQSEIEIHRQYSETMHLFRTAYVVAKHQLSFCCYTHLVDLQIENGLDMGTLLFSDHACAGIIEHIASEMRAQLIEHIQKGSGKLSLMLDESTSLSRYSALIVYVRCLVEEEAVNYFLDLVDLKALDSTSIHSCLMSCLESHGLTIKELKGKLIGLASDGASTMTGVHHGLGQLMKRDFPSLFTIHCQAHRLELAVNQAVHSVNSISHFQMFVDSLYSLYSRSPKNQRELEAAANEVGVELLRVGRMFDVRWVFSSFQAVRALWRDFPALSKHLSDSVPSRSGRDKAKYSGLVNKMTTFMFVAELALLKDCLRELKSLSLFFQSRSAQITEFISLS